MNEYRETQYWRITIDNEECDFTASHCDIHKDEQTTYFWMGGGASIITTDNYRDADRLAIMLMHWSWHDNTCIRKYRLFPEINNIVRDFIRNLQKLLKNCDEIDAKEEARETRIKQRFIEWEQRNDKHTE